MASKSGENVTRISAKTTAPKKDSKKMSRKSSNKVKVRKEPSNPFTKTVFAIGGYFRGAWVELRLVRWPTRRATWGLTFAVILFSTFFVVLIVLLDLLFKFLFQLILK